MVVTLIVFVIVIGISVLPRGAVAFTAVVVYWCCCFYRYFSGMYCLLFHR